MDQRDRLSQRKFKGLSPRVYRKENQRKTFKRRTLMSLTERVKNLKPSIGFELLNKAKQMKTKGEDVISLAIGELQGKTYDSIRKAGQKVIQEGNTKYCPSAGIPTLREKLAKEAEKNWNLAFDSENVFIANGCKYVLYVAFQSLCEAGDEVILPSPYWMSYPR